VVNGSGGVWLRWDLVEVVSVCSCLVFSPFVCGGGGVLTEEVFWLRFFLGLGCCPGVPERARYVDTPC
jgi:hypothetical protein